MLAFAVLVLMTRAPERETELVLLTAFCVLVMYEVCTSPRLSVIVIAFGVIEETICRVVDALIVTALGEYVEVTSTSSVLVLVDVLP